MRAPAALPRFVLVVPPVTFVWVLHRLRCESHRDGAFDLGSADRGAAVCWCDRRGCGFVRLRAGLAVRPTEGWPRLRLGRAVAAGTPISERFAAEFRGAGERTVAES